MACVGVAPERMALEMLTARVHHEGKRVHISPHAHEGQEPNSTLHQDLFFLFLDTQAEGELHLR